MSVTLADHLRALSDGELAALIGLRPDLVVPVPADISALAVRAQSRLSVARALDGLDQFTLEVLDALRLARASDGESAGTAAFESVLALAVASGGDPTLVRLAVERLRSLGVVHGPDHALHVVAGVDEVCSPYPAGLGRPAAQLDPAVAALAGDPARLRRTLLSAPPGARAVLDRLAEGPPIGTVSAAAMVGPGARSAERAARSVEAAARSVEADSPVRWLVAHRLLVPVAEDTVELPREVGLLLRRDQGPLGPMHPQPPAAGPPGAGGVDRSGGAGGGGREVGGVDRAGAGQAMEAVRHTEALLEALDAEAAPALRSSGGLGVRELRRLAKASGVDEATAALLLEVAYAAGLLGESGADAGEAAFLPAAGYDAWRAASLARRWHRLARAWLLMTRAPSLVGQRDERDKPVAALSGEVERVGAPALRRAVLVVLADAGPGVALTVAEVQAVLAWQAPRRAARAGDGSGYDAALAEAATLGVTGLGGLTGYARLLLSEVDSVLDEDDDPLGVHADDGDPTSMSTLDGLLPPPVDHVLLQADLSVIVPGPPEPALAIELGLVAEVESASVYRITAGSVRRALDIGYAATDLHALFARRSRTPVPQALSYLVDDVARRHGGLRAGPAGAYLRSEDEALVAEVLVDRRLAALALRRLAPTVLVTMSSPTRLLATLREAGYAPVAEDATGAAVLSRPKSRRATARPPVPSRRGDDPLAQPRLRAPRLAGIVEQIRRGDAAARAARRAPVTLRSVGGAGMVGAQAYTEAMAVLQQALRDNVRVWVGYVDAHGGTASRLVRPVSIGAGYLRAKDERTEMLHTFALSRITAAVLEEK